MCVAAAPRKSTITTQLKICTYESSVLITWLISYLFCIRKCTRSETHMEHGIIMPVYPVINIVVNYNHLISPISSTCVTRPLGLPSSLHCNKHGEIGRWLCVCSIENSSPVAPRCLTELLMVCLLSCLLKGICKICPMK